MWQRHNNQLYKEYQFRDFAEAFRFMSEVASIIKARNHHPSWTNEWNKVQIWLYTHSVNEITEKDISMSKEIDGIYKNMIEFKQDIPSVTLTKVKLFADGGSRGNPGPSAGGFVILDMSDKVIYENGKYLGITTNNQAEYHSLKGGLEAVLKMGILDVDVYMDSMLVINQMKGIYKVKNRDLWPIYEAIKEIVAKMGHVNFSHVPRELNKLADAMVNKTLDAQKSP